MMDGSLDFRDAEIANLRERDFRNEFIRSLIYSSQVVIQRAYLKNSQFLYKMFAPRDKQNFLGFAELVRRRAVVPFLFNESSLADELDFDTSKKGDQAVKSLLAELDETTCVRLAVKDDANRRACESMATAFGAGLTKLEFLNKHQRNAMATELFADSSRLQEPGAWEAFDQSIDKIVMYAIEKNRQLRKSDQLLQRKHIYKDNFVLDIQDGAINGQFRRPDRDSPFLFEIKKYVDLVYNVNLPDYLKRYTFTPEKMPSRMALQDPPREGFSHEEVSAVVENKEALEAIRRTFMAQSQKAMSLPLLRELTVADVLEIRRLPQWEAFRQSQTAVLQNPKECLQRIIKFQSDFDDFQIALSRWYNDKYKRLKTEERYCSYVTLALSIGGKLIIAGSHLTPLEKTASGVAADQIIGNIPSKIKTYAAKLMVGVYDLGKQELDADRSYSIELMQANTDLLREDVVELLEAVTTRSDDALPPVSGQVADQGIQ